jgi:hypothetical protein
MRTGCAFGVAPVLAARRPSLQGKRNHLFRQPLPSPSPWSLENGANSGRLHLMMAIEPISWKFEQPQFYTIHIVCSY